MRPSRPGPQGGQTLAEFALVIPIIILILLGLFDVGRYVFAANQVSNAAREGIRTAIVNQNQADIRARISQQAVLIEMSTDPPTCDPATNLPAQTDSSGICIRFVDQATLTNTCDPLYVGCVAVITARTTMRPITPVIADLVGDQALVSRAQQPIESVCTTGCPVR